MTAEDHYRSVMMADPPLSETRLEAVSREQRYSVWSRPVLSVRDRRLITLVCVSAEVDKPAMDAHTYAALSSGDITIEELLEFVLHFAVYCGWPRASDLEMTIRGQWQRLHEERGLSTPPFAALSVADLGPADPAQRVREGAALFEEVNLMQPVSPDSPYFYAGILNFVFGHVWARPGLTRRDRRIITLPAVGVSDAFGPLWSHVNSALGSGDLQYEEVQELAIHFRAYSSESRAHKLLEVADKWHAAQPA